MNAEEEKGKGKKKMNRRMLSSGQTNNRTPNNTDRRYIRGRHMTFHFFFLSLLLSKLRFSK